MKKHLFTLAAAFALLHNTGLAQNFTSHTDLLTPKLHYSGVAIAVADMNGDGRDDIIRLNGGTELAIELQNSTNKAFTHRTNIASMNGGDPWGICTADIDNNGYTDILAGGAYDGVKIVLANNDGTTYSKNTYDQPGTFVQGVNFADINNDGWLDAFVCHDDGTPRIYGNNGDGTFTYQPGWLDMTTTPVSDNSGNYGSVWSDIDNDGDLDLYIAKCRQGVNDPTDGRRINQLFLNDGTGVFTQDLSDNAGLRIGAQSWTADFGDIDNDGDFDCFVTNHDVSSQLLENDGAGHFTDISATAGILNQITGLPIQGIFRDFDNDGFIDILVAGTAHYLFHNNGDKTFTKITNFLNDKQMESFAIGDLNSDGFQDIYAGYAAVFNQPTSIPDQLWLNDGNSNGFFSLRLRGVQSNRDGVGAKIKLYTPQGLQVREIRSGESYGISNALQAHFGLGTQTVIDSVVVQWPSGHRDVLVNPTPNTFLSLQEGGTCLTGLLTIANTGDLVFCTGDSLTINAPEGYAAYQWSTGDTTLTTSITEAGIYKVTVTDANGCTAVSNSVMAATNPIEIPTIAVAGDSIFCAGGNVVLTASPSSSYLWTNGATTASVTVSAAGSYSVKTQGLCSTFDATPVSVQVLDNAPLPIVTGAVTWVNGPATLTAVGDSLHWYDVATGGLPIQTGGNTLALSTVPATTTFWVENIQAYGMPSVSGGMVDHVGTNFSDLSTNGQLIFDCYQSFTLSTVKVYAAVAGERRIVLQDGQGNILTAKTVLIPVGVSAVALGFNIPVGNNLVLTTDASVNQANLNSISPQLRRSNQSVTYPYTVPDVVSIKNSNFGLDRYYYFFDWKIDFAEHVCPSDRVPVTATVDPNLVNIPVINDRTGIQVFPNPTTTGLLNAQWKDLPAGTVSFSVKNHLGSTLQQNTFNWAGGAGTLPVSLTAYTSGVYWLEWRTAQGVARVKVVSVK